MELSRKFSGTTFPENDSGDLESVQQSSQRNSDQNAQSSSEQSQAPGSLRQPDHDHLGLAAQPDPVPSGAEPGQQPHQRHRQSGVLLRPQSPLVEPGQQSAPEDQSGHLSGSQESAGKS